VEAPGAALPPEEQRAAQLLSRALACEVIPHPERTLAKRPDLRAHLSPHEWADIEVTRDLSERAPTWSEPLQRWRIDADRAWSPSDADAIAQWCSRLLASDKYSDIAQKFVDSTARHHWAFLYATVHSTEESDFWIVDALDSGVALPSVAPVLPPELTGVWIAAGQRVIWWTAAHGWVDAQTADAGGNVGTESFGPGAAS